MGTPNDPPVTDPNDTSSGTSSLIGLLKGLLLQNQGGGPANTAQPVNQGAPAALADAWPVKAGAGALADGADTTQGTQEDAANTDAATDGTLMAFVKGLVSLLSGNGSITAKAAAGGFVDGAITTLGTEADAANINSATSGTAVAFLKGLVSLLSGNGTVATKGATATFTLSGASPAAAGAAVGVTVTGLGAYRSLSVYANLQGATGGTLDVYLQYSPDGGTTWVDYTHYAQLAAAAAATALVFAVSRAGQQTTITTVGTGLTPALAADTVVGGGWGDRLRVVFVAGSGTTAGANQIILVSAGT